MTLLSMVNKINENPPDIILREMIKDDVYRGFLDTLSSLSPTGLGVKEALGIFEGRKTDPYLKTIVAIATSGEYRGQVVGTLTIVFEQRFIHKGGISARIEDLAVFSPWKRKGVGTYMLVYAIDWAVRAGAYKVTLTSSDENVSYYTKFGFQKSANNLRLDLLMDSCEAIN